MADKISSLKSVNSEDDLALLVMGDLIVGNAYSGGNHHPRSLFVFAGLTSQGDNEQLRLLKRPHNVTTMISSRVSYAVINKAEVRYTGNGTFSFPDRYKFVDIDSIADIDSKDDHGLTVESKRVYTHLMDLAGI